jgi:hypothetical protein
VPPLCTPCFLTGLTGLCPHCPHYVLIHNQNIVDTRSMPTHLLHDSPMLKTPKVTSSSLLGRLREAGSWGTVVLVHLFPTGWIADEELKRVQMVPIMVCAT